MRATASGPSPAHIISSLTPFWKPCSTSIPRLGSISRAWPRSGRPAPISASGPLAAQGGAVPQRVRRVHRQGCGAFPCDHVAPRCRRDLCRHLARVEEVKVVDDYQVVFRMKSPSSMMPYPASRCCDLRIVSKAQWDKEGLEGFDKRPAGTGSYRYVDRKLGQSISYERVDNHWRGEQPEFKELEIRIVPRGIDPAGDVAGGGSSRRRPTPRTAGRGLQPGDAGTRLAAPSEWMSVYFGGQYHIPGDPKFKAKVPWTNKRVRQAMNMAVNRRSCGIAYSQARAHSSMSVVGSPFRRAGTHSGSSASTNSTATTPPKPKNS